jgi:Uma2 family endonuclease
LVAGRGAAGYNDRVSIKPGDQGLRGFAKREEGPRGARGDFTVADYMDLPDDGKRYEVLEGELVMSPSPSRRHQIVLGNLYMLLRQHVRERELGIVFLSPFDVVLSAVTVCEPDLLYVSKARAEIVTDPNVQGAPDLSIEIISPSGTKYDRVVKRKIYEEAKTAHYWLVDPEQKTVEELVLNASGKFVPGAALDLPEEVFRPACFPELSLPLARIFEDV